MGIIGRATVCDRSNGHFNFMKMPKIQSRAIAGVLWSVFDGGMSQALSLAVFIVTSRFVEPSSFGALATALLIVEFSRQILFDPIVAAVNSRKAPIGRDYDTAFLLIVGFALFFGMLVLILGRYLDLLFPATPLSHLGPAVALLILTVGLSKTHEGWFARKLLFRNLAIRSVLSIIASAIVGITLVVKGFGIWGLVAQQLTYSIFSMIVLWATAGWRPGFRTSWAEAKDLLRFSRHVSANAVMGFVSYQADTASIAYFLGPASTGVFNAAKRIGTALNQVMVTPLNRVALPAMAQVGAGGEAIRVAYLRAVGVTALGTAPVFAGMAVIAPDLVHLLLGAGWSGAAPVLSALSISFFFTTVSQYNGSVILVCRKPKWQTLITTVGLLVGVSLILVSVQFGVTGVAVAVALRAILVFPLSSSCAAYLVGAKRRDVIRSLTPGVASAALMAAVLMAVQVPLLVFPLVPRLVLTIGIGGFVYAAALVSLFRLTAMRLVKGY